MIVVGLSSGTSFDAIDVAAAGLDVAGDEVVMTRMGHLEVPYSAHLGAELLAALPPAPTTMEAVCRLDTGIGEEFAAAAVRGVDELCAGRADLVVSHGQTVFHWVDGSAVRGTLQLGQPAWISEATGLPVVSDVRAADVAAGGQGAPLASTMDVLLLGGRASPVAALNLGGIANVTVVSPDAVPVAFDTGPGNALIDEAARRVSGGTEAYDVGGLRAARGQVHAGLLDRLLGEPYYGRAAPKSTGKELFNAAYLDRMCQGYDVDGDDLVATVTTLTARTAAAACASYGVTEVVVSGGGAFNPTLMEALGRELGSARLTTSAVLGLEPEAKEAYLFALLGFLTWNGVPATVPSATGARRPSFAGRLTPGREPLSLPTPAGPPARLRLT